MMSIPQSQSKILAGKWWQEDLALIFSCPHLPAKHFVHTHTSKANR